MYIVYFGKNLYSCITMYKSEEQQKLLEKSKKYLKNAGKHLDVKELSDILRYHDWRYYVLSEPVISDFEYDQLFKLLKDIEAKHPELITPDSPTQRVAKGLTKDFPEVKHIVPMLSLENSYDEEDLNDWHERLKKLIEKEKIEYSAEPKFDGGGISLLYEDDFFIRGATRGDGQVGEEITTNLKILRSIPLKAEFSKYGIHKIEIRGEVLINKEVFKKINKERIESGLSVLANPRNAATGSLRMQDQQEVAKRGLEAFVYHVSYAVDKSGNDLFEKKLLSHSKCIEMLTNLGFKTPGKELKVFDQMNQLLKYCHEWETKRDGYPYEIDGMVLKVNNLTMQRLAGATSHHPRWAMAFKFKARQATTILKEVIFNVGRTGAVTPVAKLEPVPIGGVTVSSVSMFNEEFVSSKDIRIGDTVIVERAGDVIPYIVKSVVEARKGKEKKIIFPDKCPSCQSELQKVEEEAIWRCNNINCPDQVVEKLIHFVSKDAMDIKGFGGANVQKFYSLGLLSTIPEIYQLDFNRIAELEGFKEKSINNLKEAIEASKQQPLNRVIYGLGIRFVGETTAKTLAKNVSHINDLVGMTEEKLMELEDIGTKVAQSIAEFFANDANKKMIAKLEESGVNMETSGVQKKGNKLEGLTFVITGSMESFSRDELKDKIENEGGKVTGSVTKKTSYLVVGKDPGSKLAKAEELNVKIINEKECMDLMS